MRSSSNSEWQIPNAANYKELLGSGSHPEFLLEYNGWNSLFALKTNEDDHANELPDHIVCQFEFLAWLAHLEADCADRPELQQGYQAAQRDFCQRHLLPLLELPLELVLEVTRRIAIPEAQDKRCAGWREGWREEW